MNNEGVDSGRVCESGALPSCNERTPPDRPAAQLALLFVLCCTPDMQLLRFQSGQIGFDGAKIVFGDLKAGQFRVIALDKPELGASILQKLAADNWDQIDAVCLMAVRPNGAREICPGNDFPGSAKKTVVQSGGCGMDGVHNPPCRKSAADKKRTPIHDFKAGDIPADSSPIPQSQSKSSHDSNSAPTLSGRISSGSL